MPSHDSDARQRVQEMLMAFEQTEAVYAAAKLGLADLLVDGARSVDELAKQTRAQPEMLNRLLRYLASMGIFEEVQPGAFGLTPEAELLRDVPGSLRASALLWGELGTLAWRDPVGTVKTGQTGYQLTTGMRDWDYYEQNPEAGAVFNAGMTGGTRLRSDELIAAYDFPATGTIVDVAGGHGAFLAAILRARPRARGVLFDAPHVLNGAPPILEEAGVADRCTVIAGNFFESVPEGGAIYTLKIIIHDWDDDHATTILRNCARAMRGQGRLLVIESLMPSGVATQSPEFHSAARADVTMMMWTGGKHRTIEEFEALFKAAGLELARVIPIGGHNSIIEARPHQRQRATRQVWRAADHS
jgi:hypothetical protein